MRWNFAIANLWFHWCGISQTLISLRWNFENFDLIEVEFRKLCFHWGGFSQTLVSLRRIFANCEFTDVSFRKLWLFISLLWNFIDRNFRPEFFWPGFSTRNFLTGIFDREFSQVFRKIKICEKFPSNSFDSFRRFHHGSKFRESLSGHRCPQPYFYLFSIFF